MGPRDRYRNINRGHEGMAGMRVAMNTRKPLRQRTAVDAHKSESAPVAKLGSEIKAKIGQQLRLMYNEVLNQKVPERFSKILQGLDDPTDKDVPRDPP